MSQLRSPLRPRSSLSSQTSSNVLTPLHKELKPRISMSNLRRPNTAMGKQSRPESPRLTCARLRAGSSLGVSSRPSTPSYGRNQEPYTGTISVSIRPNPLSVHPMYGSPWEIDMMENSISNRDDSTSFFFDNVFPVDKPVENKEVYRKACSGVVEQFLSEGHNGTIFAYGMTGSGKTYSMKGEKEDPGIAKLVVDDIFETMREEPGKRRQVYISYLEIYNERLFDLLEPSNSSILKIRDDPQCGTKIVGISTPAVVSKEQLLHFLKKGDVNRKTSVTDFNNRSSRSHSIIQIKLDTTDLIHNTETSSTLSLCDLAGSEKGSNTIERRKEGAYINKSLLALSTVIHKLSLLCSNVSSPGSFTEHIPYRDSKLTRLLQPALSGSSLVLILCTVNLGNVTGVGGAMNISETYSTLRFAARAKDVVVNIKNTKKSNVNDYDSVKQIQELKRIIESQRSEISVLRMYPGDNMEEGMESSPEKNVRLSELEATNQLLLKNNEHLSRLNDLLKTETIILGNDTLNEILGNGFESYSQQAMMANLEEYYKRISYEREEYKTYISHLEAQLKWAIQNGSIKNEISQLLSKVPDSHLEAALKDQEEEIMRLRELIKDKDHVIRSLTKTSKLRNMIENNQNKENKYSGSVNKADSSRIFPNLKGVHVDSKVLNESL